LSVLERDRSDELAKRFAVVASTYFDQPAQARTPAARVPLENLFRILQMLRYDAFSDDRRSGVLELEGFGELGSSALDDSWHKRIEQALRTALVEVFANTPKENAVSQVQTVLTWLATNEGSPPIDVRTRSRTFLERFVAALG
jgi:hypothetical protein